MEGLSARVALKIITTPKTARASAANSSSLSILRIGNRLRISFGALWRTSPGENSAFPGRLIISRAPP